MAVDERGAIHVVVVGSVGKARPNRFGDADGRVFYTRSDDGGAHFAPPRVVSADDEPLPFYHANPQVVPDARRGRLHVVYPTGTPDGRWEVILATTDEKSGAVRRARVNDDPPCAIHMAPSAALDPASGRVHVIWAENRGGVGRMAYASCDADGARCDANEAVSDAPFARFSLGRHSPAWRGEYDALLVDDRRGLLHAVWTQPVDEGGVARSRVFHAAARLR